jgi:hypothetical protein
MRHFGIGATAPFQMAGRQRYVFHDRGYACPHRAPTLSAATPPHNRTEPMRRAGGLFDPHANIRSLHEYGYTVTEHDAEQPWIVLNRRHETVELEEGAEFFEWAARRYPRERSRFSSTPGR